MSKETIWKNLKSKGFSDTACAAIMGNIQAESAFLSNNFEDRTNKSLGITDAEYTAGVDSGKYDREFFARENGAYGGYGLCQWTEQSRSRNLYDFCKNRGTSIADENMQLDFLLWELQNEFRPVYNVLNSDASLYDMTKKFLVTFENPQDKSDKVVQYRVGLAQAIYDQLHGTPTETPTVQPETPTDTVTISREEYNFLTRCASVWMDVKDMLEAVK